MLKSLVAFAALALITLAAPARAEDDDAPRTVVHVDASSAVVLARVAQDGRATPVCTAPCDVAVEPAAYRLTGDDVQASNDFRVPATPRAVSIQVDASTKRAFTTGVVMTALGSVFGLAGATFLLVAAAQSSSFDSLGTSVGLGVGGVAALAVGLGVGIPGVVLLASNARSRARLYDDERVAKVAPPAPRATGLMLPIVSGRF